MSRFLVLLLSVFLFSCATKHYPKVHLQEDFRDHHYLQRDFR